MLEWPVSVTPVVKGSDSSVIFDYHSAAYLVQIMNSVECAIVRVTRSPAKATTISCRIVLTVPFSLCADAVNNHVSYTLYCHRFIRIRTRGVHPPKAMMHLTQPLIDYVCPLSLMAKWLWSTNETSLKIPLAFGQR